jgi:SAM-dependent methyltransferase
MQANSIPKTDLDAPETTAARREVIFKKPLLKAFYDSFYSFLTNEHSGGFWVELGSGAGYIKQFIPDIKTSDYLDLPDQDLIIDATKMPFNDASVDGICMLDVLHHIPDNDAFLREAVRVLKPGGKIVMQEPANTFFSRFIYQHFHHEPFLPDAPDWKLPPGGPLSMANGALPWIIFIRDRARFEAAFPDLRILSITGVHPVLYLLSGGFTAPQLVPGFLAPLITRIDSLLSKIPALPMFMRVVVEKRAL